MRYKERGENNDIAYRYVDYFVNSVRALISYKIINRIDYFENHIVNEKGESLMDFRRNLLKVGDSDIWYLSAFLH